MLNSLINSLHTIDQKIVVKNTDDIVITFSRYYLSERIQYVLYKETAYSHPTMNNDDIKTHKEFLIEFINSLILLAKKKITK